MLAYGIRRWSGVPSPGPARGPPGAGRLLSLDLAGHPCILHAPRQTGAPGPGSTVAMGGPCPPPSLRLPSRQSSHRTPGRGEGWKSAVQVCPVTVGAHGSVCVCYGLPRVLPTSDTLQLKAPPPPLPWGFRSTRSQGHVGWCPSCRLSTSCGHGPRESPSL